MRNRNSFVTSSRILFIILTLILLSGVIRQQAPALAERAKEEKPSAYAVLSLPPVVQLEQQHPQLSQALPAYAALFMPHLQFWGFDNRDPVVDIGGYEMSFQVFTKENTYGIASGRLEPARERVRLGRPTRARPRHSRCPRRGREGTADSEA